MAQPIINAKIEELQFRLKTDPKSRLFFPLAEELRKHGKLAEAEQVLRTGLNVHATYLSAWVSLGRVLREQRKNAEAAEALTMAMQVDPGNVVAARLLADTYVDLGEKVEAIKKYKLVHALMPSDEELEAKIERLDREIQAPVPIPLSAPQGSSEPQHDEPPPPSQSPFSDAELEDVFQEPPPSVVESEGSAASAPAGESAAPELYQQTVDTPFDTGDDEPMAAHHVESPFEEPSAYTAAALQIEHPEGMHIEEAPTIAVDPWSDEPPAGALYGEPAADVFAPATPEAEPQTQPDEDDDVTATTTMADLYVRQGLVDEARKIYEHLLQRDPSDADVRAKLDALGDQQQSAPAIPGEQLLDEEPEPIAGNPKVLALQKWLDKVGRREEGRV